MEKVKQVKILDVDGIHFGFEAFDNGEIVDIVRIFDDGECERVVVNSKKRGNEFHIFEGEWYAIEFL